MKKLKPAMVKTVSYKILTNSSPYKLEDLVIQYLDWGWKLVGGPSALEGSTTKLLRASTSKSLQKSLDIRNVLV